MPSLDPYQTLGLSPDADAATIKRAYRRLALRWHPDRNQGAPAAEAQFKRIHEAFTMLSGSRPARTTERTPPHAPFDGPTWAESARAAGYDEPLEPIPPDEDPFAHPGDPRLELDVAIRPADAIRGARLPVRFNDVEFIIRLPPCVGDGARMRIPADRLPPHAGPRCALVLVIHLAREASSASRM